MTKKIQIAICYDFDGTLSPKNMQEYGFMETLDIRGPQKFWEEVDNTAKKQNADNISVYMKLMISKSKENEIQYDKETLKNYGKSIELFKGVETWFDRINEYGKKQGVLVKHFIISSGLKEMIEGTKIAKEFEKVFASSFMYDPHGIPEWPAVVLNFTTKTRYLFEINKGKNCSNINKYIPDEDREIPFSNMIYIGDGETDIPCMKIVKKEGGHSIAVYKPKSSKKLKIAEQLVKDKRVNFMASADYSEDSQIERIVKAIIDKVVADTKVNILKPKHNQSSELKSKSKDKNNNVIEQDMHKQENIVIENVEKQKVKEIKEKDDVMDMMEESTENNTGIW